ncbi:hypothetical protein ONE63_004644 [Megalurothrips usitatus]|uniref:Neurotransmitter-gated ion-channel ligand-binding domain-containing protein n=1 Tax=Megalurothrips usitatus TaxID=439358 RepID=A0AAV7X3X9_9NEOP|nr:hypothetical protein ONE63_004644 [Megalurothrips usitatus]
MGYDKFARPVAHDQRTEVDIFVILKHVDVDEFRGVMSLDVWLKMFWTDPKLKWKPSQYGNLTTLFVADHEIWQPDLMLYNSASRPDLASSGHDAPYLVVAPDGGVIWVPTTRLETYCDLDLRRWPFDEHTCEYRLGSWVFDKSALDLVTHNDTFTHELHVDAEQWRLLDIHFERKEVLYDNYPESFVDVCLSVTARRRGTAYYSVITGPLSASFFLLLFSFFVPYHRVERLVLHAVNILMLTVALAYMTQVVPILTQKPPYVGT